MLSTIAVDLPRADVTSPYVRALLDACSVGAPTGVECVLDARDDGVDGRRVAVAVVAWDGPSRNGAHVRVVLGAELGEASRTRELSFAPADPEGERWRAVGFAIATLAGDLAGHGRGGETTTSAERSRDTVPNAPPPRAAAPAAEPAYWLDATVFVGTGAASSPAIGGEVHASRRLEGTVWFVAGSARCTVQSLDTADHVSVLRPAASLGAGAVAARIGEHVRLGFRVEAMLELIQVTGTDGGTGVSDQAARWVPGVQQGLDGAWVWSSRLGVVVGVQAVEMTGGTDVRVRGDVVGRIPAVGWAARGGLRVGFP